MIINFNIFNLQRQPNGFSDVDHSALNKVGDFSYNELEFEHMDEFIFEYESFLQMMSLRMMNLVLICALWTLLLMLFLPVILLLFHLISTRLP